MRQFLKFFTVLILVLNSHVLSAETLGRYISSEAIQVTPEIKIPASAEVNFLGVIDVVQSVSESGKLATFKYGTQIYNADATLFYKVNKYAAFRLSAFRSFDAGNSTSVCSAMLTNSKGSSLQFLDDNYSQFFQVTSNGSIIDGYSVTKPRDINSWQERNSEFCITGLDHSETFNVSLLPGLGAVRGGFSARLDKPLSFKVKTPPVTPSIKLDGSKTILANSHNSSITIEYVNLSEIEVTLHRIDLASLPSYEAVLKVLDGEAISRLNNFWGDQIAQKSFSVENELNQSKTINLNFSDVITPNANGLFVATFSSPDLEMSHWENRPTQWFSISDASIQVFKGQNNTTLLVNSFQNTDAIEGAAVEIVAENNRTLFTGSTDKNGRVQLSNDLISGSGGFSPEFIIVKAAEFGTSILQIASLDEKPRFLNGGEIKNHEKDVYLTSDREIYRAGDTINIFGAVRKLNLETITARELTLKLLNRTNDTIFKEDLSSNVNGAFATSVPLKKSLPFGRYSLQIENVDKTVLAQHTINLEDFVPLTIEARLEIENGVWKLATPQEIKLSGEYFSGGPATGLGAKISGFIKTTNNFQNKTLEGYFFGTDTKSTVTALANEFDGTLDANGNFKAVLITNYTAEASSLYEVNVDGVVFDIGGRPNKASEIIALDTSKSYVGVRTRFGDYVDEGVTPSFNIVNVDRSGKSVGFDGVKYTVQKVYYRYNWYYNNGWRWNRVRVSDETVSSGSVSGKVLTLSSPLNWGRHEIVVTNTAGFKTVLEFYVGWGSNVKPASEPEELAVSYSDGFLRGSAQFTGKLSVLVADEDIQSMKTFDVSKGDFSIPVKISSATEPGVHLLTSLVRPIETGSEHLPQISLGKVWVPIVSENRTLNLAVRTNTEIDSATPISISLSSSSATGSAAIFLVDEGIHALTGYQNKNLKDFYLNERALNYGVLSNFGELISQNLSLSTIRVGGDGEMLSSAATVDKAAVDKSEFFKTIAYASPIQEIENGLAEFVFPKTLEWEGKLRVVVFALSETGFGFLETNIKVQDPVSIDASMPRFVTPNAGIKAAMNIRWHNYSGPVKIKTTIGQNIQSDTFDQPDDNSLEVAMPISTNAVGTIPVLIEVVAGERTYRRSYSIVSRQSSYPNTELQSVELEKKNLLGVGSVFVQPHNTRTVNINASGSTFTASLTSNLGINLHQLTKDLGRYPYGCVEQVSSKARGLMAYADVRGLNKETSKKINAGIDKLIAKQRFSGAFGYWNRNSRVYKSFQPYAIDTLQKLLPYSNDKAKIIASINSGLEYLYTTNFDTPRVELYSYGLLARSGYEVTSRARYAIDQKLNSISRSIDDLTLAYWVAALLNDTKRMLQLSEKARLTLDQVKFENITLEPTRGTWFTSWETSNLHAQTAPKYAHLLTDLDSDKLSPIFETILSNTHQYLSQKQYRSTQSNAKLVAIQLYTKQSLAGTKITVDGTQYELDASGMLPLTLDQLKQGFEISHNASSTLYLNVKSTGQRRGLDMLDNGYKVQKFWYDQAGNELDLSNRVLVAKQGDLFTVVIEIDRTRSGSGTDLLVTDLLSTGYEIEDAILGDPKINGRPIDFTSGIKAAYTASMDDRFIAHFDRRWKKGSFAYVRYTVRSTHASSSMTGDAHVEEMYVPEINGRSNIVASIVLAR